MMALIRWLPWVALAIPIAVATAWIGPPLDDPHGQWILQELRLPRALAGAMVGAVLSAAGAVVQILLRNPLATPSTIGTTAGATLGVLAVLVLGSGSTWMGLPILPAAAFAGALLVTLIIASVAARDRARTEDVLLAGIALTLATGAIASGLRLGVDQVTSLSALRWSLGSLTIIGPDRISMLAPFVVISLAGMLWLIRPLEVLISGIERARTRGVEVTRVRTLGLGLASLGVAACVATCGPIAFVGLICPHLVRRVVGSAPRTLLPASILLGAVFLPLCDSIGRVIWEQREIPVGVITAALGAPVLFMIVVRRGRTHSKR
ncbi:MAG: iron ABC transporter permease [Planctomycetota bacterium]|nr:iron ABC transporter permease [Planctomycetota bacterium]